MDTRLYPVETDQAACIAAGFRFGDRGTHTSRTMMLAELRATLAAVPRAASRADYVAAIVEHNCLSKPTSATRVLTAQRLSELYALDSEVQLFRILRGLWDIDIWSQPLLTLLIAMARDPLLAATVPSVVPLSAGMEFGRGAMRDAIRAAVRERLNDATVEKVVRNAASSWSQAGHLVGRTFKIRQAVEATPTAIALALFLASTVGYRGHGIFTSGWVAVLDADAGRTFDLAADAKRLGLIDLRQAGDVLDINFDRLDPTGRSI